MHMPLTYLPAFTFVKHVLLAAELAQFSPALLSEDISCRITCVIACIPIEGNENKFLNIVVEDSTCYCVIGVTRMLVGHGPIGLQ